MLCFLLVAGLSVLSFQLVKIQVVDRKKYADTANNSYKRVFPVAHTRGMIIDRNDEVIARDIVQKSIYIDKYQFESVEVASSSLACKFFREMVASKSGTADGVEGDMETRKLVKSLDKILKPLLSKKVLAAPAWMAVKKEKRSALVMQGARRLQENLDVSEIQKLNIDFVINEYSRPLGVTEAQLRKLLDLEDSRKHVLVTKGIEFKAARKLEKLLKEHNVKGFDFQDYVRREYREPWMATHLVGFSDHEHQGKAGVEGQLNRYLSGRDGKETRFLDVRGYVIPGDQQILPPKHGRDVRLTLDMRIQAIVEEELDAGMKLNQAQKGAIVVMDPHTGEVLAMASRPHYNLNNKEDIVKNGFNYAIQASNETGSTVKIIATAAAMNEGLANYDTEVNCGWGILQERGFTVKDHHPYGMLALWQVLQKSSNTGAWQFAKMIGSKKFYEYATRFGYGRRTGIRLVGESKGHTGNTGNTMDFSRCTYGYVLTASPLQIATAYCVIANGGTYIPPHIIKDIHAKNGMIIEHSSVKRQRQGKHRVIKPEVAKSMRDALATVMNDKGTARKGRTEGYKCGGKTGTNHKVENGVFNRNKYITSFAGMCPIDKPNFVCVVVIDDPAERMVWDENQKKMVEFRRGGGSVADPIFGKLVKRIAQLRGIKPVFEEEE